MTLIYHAENGENENRIRGFSAASTGDRITLSPEVEKLTEDILNETRHLSVKDKAKHNAALKNNKEQKRKKSMLTHVIFFILSIAVVLVAFEVLRMFSIFNSVNYVTNNDDKSDVQLFVSPSYVQANVSHTDETKNIMLIGCDIDESGISRSDSMIILSLDHNNQKIKMTSLMRDMYLRIPQNGRHKLNAAYVYGGADLLLHTVYANFGLDIDNYVCVDYTAFAEIVDYIGGVDIDIEQSELAQFNKYVNGKDNQIQQAGLHHFNGQQALSYCRIRKVGTDTARTARQRKMLDKIIEKCTQMSFFEIESMVEAIAPKITTNLTHSELLALTMEGMSCSNYDTLHMRIPADGTWSGIYIGQTWYMKFDLEQNAQYLNDFIYGDDTIAEKLAAQLEESDAAAEP